MYIEYIKTKTSTGKLSHTAILLRHSFRENGKIKKKTIANLTHVKPETLEAYRLIIKHQKDPSVLLSQGDIQVTQGNSIGASFVVSEIAKRLHIATVLGNTKEGKLALFQILSRIIAQGSRLSSIRLAASHNMTDVLGIDFSFNEDHLYTNLAYLAAGQKKFEQELFQKSSKKDMSDLFLYDVTSSYFEGEQNELAAYGYNRDRKHGKKQVVMGLLCTKEGEPIGVDLFPGNTTDIQTFTTQSEKVKKDFGCSRVTFVTDRGIIKGNQMKNLKDDKCFYITAITKPQIEKLLKDNILQLSLFDETIKEIEYAGNRLIFRRNPERAHEIRLTRENKYQHIVSLCIKKNQYLAEHKKAKLVHAEQELQERITKLKLNRWVNIKKDEVKRVLELVRDEDKLQEETSLDGCYCMKTNLLEKDIDKQTIHDRYKDLGMVEWAFRTEKTGLLELRPWYVITEESSRGHAFVTMLAYKIIQYLKEAWKSENLTVEEGLRKLATITTVSLTVKGVLVGNRIAKPDALSKRLLSLAEVTLPETIPHLGAIVASRKKLQKERK